MKIRLKFISIRLVAILSLSLLLASSFENKSETLNFNNTILVEILDTSAYNLKERFL